MKREAQSGRKFCREGENGDVAHIRDVPASFSNQVNSFSVLLALQTFELTTLRLDLTLLLLDLALCLRVLIVPILHFVADRIAADAANATTDCGARQRMADGRANYRAGTGTKQGASARAHLTISKRLSRTSAKEEHNRECNSGGRNPTFAHKKTSS